MAKDRSRILPWLVGTAGLVALIAVLFWPRGAAPGVHGAHPEPRRGVSGDVVLSPESLDLVGRTARAYRLARANAAVLDGIYCHCRCKENFGHVSLLTCFESDHGSRCDICICEVELASLLHARGTSLAEIQQAVDAQFGG